MSLSLLQNVKMTSYRHILSKGEQHFHETEGEIDKGKDTRTWVKWRKDHSFILANFSLILVQIGFAGKPQKIA